MRLAVNAGAVAAPFESVPTSATFEFVEANVPPAPLAGAVNTTETPAQVPVSWQPFVFASCTCRLVWNGLPTCPCCGLPATRMSVFGGFHPEKQSLVAAPADPLASAAAAAAIAAGSSSRRIVIAALLCG